MIFLGNVYHMCNYIPEAGKRSSTVILKNKSKKYCPFTVYLRSKISIQNERSWIEIIPDTFKNINEKSLDIRSNDYAKINFKQHRSLFLT